MKRIIKKIKKNKKRVIIISAVFLAVALPALVWALNTWNTGYRVNHQNRTIYFRYGNGTGTDDNNFCSRAVNATSNKDLFMPTKTYGEMKAFDANAPINVAGVSACCEFSRCKRFDPTWFNNLPPEYRTALQCDERSGCCPVYEDEPSISGEPLAGFFDCIRQGPLTTNSCSAWSATCDTKGIVNCSTGASCDCECRQKVSGADAGFYCADWMPGIPKRTCRVRTDKSISQTYYKDVNGNGGLDPYDDWPDAATPNPLW